MTETGKPLPIKQALAGAGLAAVAALATGQGEAPAPPVDQIAHIAAPAPEQQPPTDEIQTANGTRFKLPGILGLDDTSPETPPRQHLDIGSGDRIDIQDAAEIAKDLLGQPQPSAPQTAPSPRQPEAERKPEINVPPVPTLDDTLRQIIEDGPATDADNPLLNEGYPEITIDTTVPAEVQKLMKRDVLRMFNGACSGSLIRDEQGIAIGAVTAKHCGGLSEKQVVGSDGLPYVVTTGGTGGLEAMIGDSADNLSSVGKITSAYIDKQPGNNTLEHDLAITSFEGQSENVLQQYKRQALTPEEIKNLQPGDKIYLSGWPANQSNNTGASRRQEFAMSVVGFEGSKLWAVIATNADGAECSPGESGGTAFAAITETGPDGSPETVAKRIGATSTFYDLTGEFSPESTPESIAALRKTIEKQFGITLPENAATLCSFATDVPDLQNNGMLVRLVEKPDDIRGYEELYSPAAYERKARKYFTDPANERQVIDGLYPHLTKEFGFDGFIDRPFVYYDSENDATVIAWENPKAEGGMEFSYVGAMNDGAITVYERTNYAGVTMHDLSKGDIIVMPDQGATDKDGFTFGRLVVGVNPDWAKPYRVTYDYFENSDNAEGRLGVWPDFTEGSGGKGGK